MNKDFVVLLSQLIDSVNSDLFSCLTVVLIRCWYGFLGKAFVGKMGAFSDVFLVLLLDVGVHVVEGDGLTELFLPDSHELVGKHIRSRVRLFNALWAQGNFWVTFAEKA